MKEGEIVVYTPGPGNNGCAEFWTRIRGKGNRMVSKRAKHIVYRDEFGYTHAVRFLVRKEEKPITAPGIQISERVFFGKFRYAVMVENYLLGTWRKIASAAEVLDDLFGGEDEL